MKASRLFDGVERLDDEEPWAPWYLSVWTRDGKQLLGVARTRLELVELLVPGPNPPPEGGAVLKWELPWATSAETLRQSLALPEVEA